MADHPRLRQREREKRTDGKEGDETIGDPCKSDEQDACSRPQIKNADVEDEAAPGDAERFRQETVLRDHPAQSREIDEACIRRQRQHAQERADRDVIERAVPHHRSYELREYAAIAGLALVHRADTIGAHEVGDANEQRSQHHDDGQQGAMSVFHGRLAKRAHAVRDCFHASHRRAAAGKGAQQQPQPGAFRGLSHRRRSDDRRRRAVLHDYSVSPDAEDEQKAADEQIRGHGKHPARVERATQVDECDQREQAQAQRKDIGM